MLSSFFLESVVDVMELGEYDGVGRKGVPDGDRDGGRILFLSAADIFSQASACS